MIRRYRLDLLLGGLLLVNGALMLVSPRSRFDAVVLHHSASDRDNYERIRQYHFRERRWHDAAYHLILSNGSTEVPAGHLEATDRYRNYAPSTATRSRTHNRRALHLCVIGDYERGPFPAELRAPLANALRRIQRTYAIGDEGILFHGADCSPSKCPGRHLDKAEVLSWVRELADTCPPDVRLQQGAVISSAGYSLHSGREVLGRLALLSLALALPWIGFFHLRSVRVRIEQVTPRPRPVRIRIVPVPAPPPVLGDEPQLAHPPERKRISDLSAR